ncbi:GNAT family N-acetyltransferase [Caldibacillus lycopersici]|uniref:GNAT family N-acetyltransferase n=1 Tax=Perspicuibacillus lycopersici TaxID=1325689 RepID=A0AAE3LQ88_9BACI|nr:GNAT family N-acetyltransferase [Perspicuibacillus lycopersici]MCU9613209.1 GNAT family N-acetyltransferase [Perspicuibacillus lycopersici]
MIRFANIRDSEEITRLCFQLGYPSSEAEITARMERIVNSKDEAIFVFEIKDNKLAGWVHIFGKCLIELEYAEIGGLVVDSTVRRQRIGSQLMKQCERWAKENGYQEIRLRSGGQRKEAHEFYKSIGYDNINWQQVFSLKL